MNQKFVVFALTLCSTKKNCIKLKLNSVVNEDCFTETFCLVVLDVNRSLKRFPPGIGEKERPALQEQLTRLIIRVIIAHPHLHYYQG